MSDWISQIGPHVAQRGLKSGRASALRMFTRVDVRERVCWPVYLVFSGNNFSWSSLAECALVTSRPTCRDDGQASRVCVRTITQDAETA
jgi:hypothetical protein